jgi:cytochrome P450
MRFSRNSIRFASELFRRYGRVAAMARGGRTRLFNPRPDCPGTVLVYQPELIKEVATHHDLYHKFHLAGVVQPVGDTSARKTPLRLATGGLFGVNGDEHRRQRKLMAPAFYPAKVATYADAMVAITERTLAKWQIGQTRNVATDMAEVAREIASECLFGEPLGEQGREMTASVQRMLSMFNRPLVRLLQFDLPGLPYRRLLDAAAEAQKRTQGVIERRRTCPHVDNALAMLLRAREEDGGGALTEEELIGHASILFAAGHETSANSLTWTLFLLSQHPRVHADLFDELKTELRGEAARPENFERLPLLDRVVKESMRIIPAVPWNGRITSAEAVLDGYRLPAGTEVLASIYHTHHMPEIFPDPERFNVERWEGRQPTGYEYNPFSAGPRICIGAGFAIQEIKIVLSLLLQRFRVELVPRQRIDHIGTIVMYPPGGITMRLEPAGSDYDRGAGGVTGRVRELVHLPA